MRITNDRSGRSRGTASADRREQIVTATIQMLATHGYVGTSFDSVVAHAGLSSKRLITYHFQTKEQLYEDVIAQIARTAADFMTPLIGLHATRRDRLRAYITANIQFIAEFPEHVRALQEIVAHLPRVSAARAMTDEALDRLVDAFLDGQRAGEFRAFDPLVMAVSLRASMTPPPVVSSTALIRRRTPRNSRPPSTSRRAHRAPPRRHRIPRPSRHDSLGERHDRRLGTDPSNRFARHRHPAGKLVRSSWPRW